LFALVSQGDWRVLAAAVCLVLVLPIAAAGGGRGTNPEPLDPVALTAPQDPADYVIGPLDKLGIHVFQVKDLSMDNAQVDASGQIELPLIGKVMAAGKTTGQLADEIAARLGERYLQSPQVSVTVEDSASQKVTVEGEVKQPGVFQMKGRTTLMQAIAMAGGPGDNADLHNVAVIRSVGGARKAAICDYALVRAGRAPDPLIMGDDVVVMNGSTAKTLWSTLMKNLPIFTLLAYLR
jgi:polysaccharide export outer membrane protein